MQIPPPSHRPPGSSTRSLSLFLFSLGSRCTPPCAYHAPRSRQVAYNLRRLQLGVIPLTPPTSRCSVDGDGNSSRCEQLNAYSPSPVIAPFVNFPFGKETFLFLATTAWLLLESSSPLSLGFFLLPSALSILPFLCPELFMNEFSRCIPTFPSATFLLLSFPPPPQGGFFSPPCKKEFGFSYCD